MKSLLDATKQTVAGPSYPGYPEERLVITDLDSLHNLTLPDGEWTTRVTTFPSFEEQEQLRSEGYELDDFGRPLHPWLREMLSDPNVGVVTGLGEYWHWGPNRAADPIVINTDDEPKVLLIKRGDTGAWALPGGFIDAGENGAEAARRELFEEAGLMIDGDPVEIYSGVVADARTTAHAWAETMAVLWRINGTPDVIGNDDATDARWFPVKGLPANAHGSHSILIEEAIARLDEASVSHVPDLPIQITSYKKAKGGNMTYTRLIATTVDGSRRFIKNHDAHAFADPIEEAHSRLYLQKEKLLYDHMAAHGFVHLPSDIELQRDTLSMEALLQEDGWQWRAPKDSVDVYIGNIFAALDELGTLPLPKDFLDNKGPISDMLYSLGWGQYDAATSPQNIREKFAAWQPQIRENFKRAAEQLADLSHQLYMDRLPSSDEFVLTHHDMRQSNIAWHPDHGVRLIDWSWAGAGPKNADATMLLIDLHKAGHDIANYMDRFNPGYATLMIGFWLHHCQLPPRIPNSEVRFHQALSAVCAYDLLMKYRQR